MLAVNESINAVDNNYALLLFVWLMLNKINSPLANKKIPNYVNAEFMIESLQQFNTETSGTIAGSDFNKIEDLLNASMYIWREAGMCQGAARRTLHILDALQQYLSVGKWNTDDELPENRRSNRIAGRTSFVEGTSAVAIGWDREKRERVRRAWGVGNTQAAGYDDAVETWLRMKGIDPSAIRGQQVVVLWIRKSGERGGAHFENDTSFHWLYRQIQQYNGATVILTGDDKPDGQGGSKADMLAMPDRRVYNLTQFWKDGSNELKAWGGNTRTGQFRLFDYMNRNSAGLKHVGAMSGNLEAMALLGHRTEVHAGTPEDSGVSRMMAYSVHDMGVEEEADKLHYDFAFNQQRLNTTTPYEKKAAVYYVELKRRLSSIYKSIINKNIYRIKVSPEIKFMIDENIKEVNILRDQLKQNAQIRSVAKKDIGGINLGLKLKCMKIPEVRKRRAEISEKVGRLEADERIRERISAIEPHVIDYDVSDWKNHPSLFDNSSEGMGCLWKLDVTKRKVIIDGIIRQAPFSSVWRALSAGMKPTSDFYMDMEKTYQKTNMVVWNTIWRIAGCYYYLIQHPPKNEERVDKQKEQLLDFIFIQTARIMSRSRKVQGRRNSS